MLGVNHLIGFGAGGDSYAIEHSCELATSDYLYRTFGTPDDAKAFTLALWVKRDSAVVTDYIFSSGGDDWIYGNPSSKYGWNVTSGNYRQIMTATHSTGVWNHLVFSYDSANGTAGDRMRIYFDGVEITSFSPDTNPPLNQTSTFNTATQHNLGKVSGAGQYFNGKMADVHFIDGLALGADSFLSAGVPKRYAGAFGSNGFHLDFANSGSLGTDVSGNGNNFTASGTPAQSADVPT